MEESVAFGRDQDALPVGSVEPGEDVLVVERVHGLRLEIALEFRWERGMYETHVHPMRLQKIAHSGEFPYPVGTSILDRGKHEDPMRDIDSLPAL